MIHLAGIDSEILVYLIIFLIFAGEGIAKLIIEAKTKKVAKKGDLSKKSEPSPPPNFQKKGKKKRRIVENSPPTPSESYPQEGEYEKRRGEFYAPTEQPDLVSLSRSEHPSKQMETYSQPEVVRKFDQSVKETEKTSSPKKGSIILSNRHQLKKYVIAREILDRPRCFDI